MLYSGLKISENTVLPASPQEGQLAILTQVDGSFQPGTYVYRSSQWRVLDNTSYTYTATGGIQLVGSNFSLTNTGVAAGTYGSASQVPALTIDANGRVTEVTLANIVSSVPSALTPYDICSCVLGKPDAGATVFMALAVRAFNIPSGYTASQAKASVAATASSVFTIYKNGSSIGTFTFAASGSTASFSGAGGSIVAGDLITVVAPGAQDATLANIAFTIAGNLQ